MRAAAKSRSVGPIAPWRLPATVLTAAATSGVRLFDATTTGVGLDEALVRTLAVGAITWVVLGRIDRVIASVDAAAEDAPVPEPIDATAHDPADAPPL